MKGVHASPRVQNARLEMAVLFEGEHILYLAGLGIGSELETNQLKLPPPPP